MLFLYEEERKQKENLLSVQRLKDIEDGKILPTIEEFFKLCILYEIPEAEILLEKMYPGLYKAWNKEIELARKRLDRKKKKKRTAV